MEVRAICVLGSDGRMDYAAQYFYHYGYDVYREASAIDVSTAVVLPPPSGDKMMSVVLPYLKEGCILYGGMVSNRFKHECELIDIPVNDYLKWDKVTAENAYLTAKGIIREAEADGAVIEGSDCMVTGFGFCGKALAAALAANRAYVDVTVRKKSLMDDIKNQGYGFVDMAELTVRRLEKYSYIFNTVPAPVLDSRVLDNLSRGAMIYDIASAPGGTDFSYCKTKGIYAVNSLGIPGREYPKEAGNIIAGAVINDLAKR